MAPTAGIGALGNWRRLALLLGGAVALGFVVVTMAGAVPRPVSVSVHVPDPPPSGLLVRTTISLEGETVAEGTEAAHGGGGETLLYRFWLPPGEHRLEVRGRGCTSTTLRFDPAESRRVHLVYRCDVGGVR